MYSFMQGRKLEKTRIDGGDVLYTGVVEISTAPIISFPIVLSLQRQDYLSTID